MNEDVVILTVIKCTELILIKFLKCIYLALEDLWDQTKFSIDPNRELS